MIGVLGFDFRRGPGIFLFTTASRRDLGPTQPPVQQVPGALSLGVKRRGVKLTTHLHLVPRSKNEWNYTSTHQYAFMAWCSVKSQGQLYLYLLLSCLEILRSKPTSRIATKGLISRHGKTIVTRKSLCSNILLSQKQMRRQS
jgi:hypothetical protein